MEFYHKIPSYYNFVKFPTTIIDRTNFTLLKDLCVGFPPCSNKGIKQVRRWYQRDIFLLQTLLDPDLFIYSRGTFLPGGLRPFGGLQARLGWVIDERGRRGRACQLLLNVGSTFNQHHPLIGGNANQARDDPWMTSKKVSAFYGPLPSHPHGSLIL